MSLSQLVPESFWRHFEGLCQIPRPSGHEARVSEWIQGYADRKGLQCIKDEAGNLIIRKPARKGKEHIPGIVLQGHLDIVPQKEPDSLHDFKMDPIETLIEGDWVTANGTTLGADNGAGVAAALAILDDPYLQHGPLEVLLTVNEEDGMDGAFGLKPNLLQGKYLLNLDSEDEGEVYVGCAGGVDVTVTSSLEQQPLAPEFIPVKLSVSGLKGGHSGININSGRISAIKLMVRLLRKLQSIDFRLVSMDGGGLRNAIPSTADVVVAVTASKVAEFQQLVQSVFASIASESSISEPNMQLQAEMIDRDIELFGLHMVEQRKFLQVMHAVQNGVQQMSDEVAGVVETSSNIGIVKLKKGELQVFSLVRSLKDSARQNLAESIADCFRLMNADVAFEGAYPGWQPRVSSGLLTQFQAVHQRLFNQPAKVKVIHAGLECGIFSAAYPAMEMISIGPTIKYPHSPAEKMSISSVQQFWTLLSATLESIDR
ncbi:aminoacyl-histidine dipeptidase [Pelagibaculum spongiae]|uniref:Cytosol non-specific dipeptidase n=1 Tax=Pelagibaculum spongiae TaxID=2080658 RepID=A0A2V1GN52_9GAMM|nr:aminoacyl-histidine dipeptidase [Pelagibaculum spongiae]PVZ62960.1 cytosol nonspecific dipeptidase [Pelagibaculum spongiae]